MCKLDFIDWIFDLEEYLIKRYMSNELEIDVSEYKTVECVKMSIKFVLDKEWKKKFVDRFFFFFHNYYDIIHYTIVDYRLYKFMRKSILSKISWHIHIIKIIIRWIIIVSIKFKLHLSFLKSSTMNKDEWDRPMGITNLSPWFTFGPVI